MFTKRYFQVIYDKLVDLVGNPNVPLVLVGNKNDLHNDRRVTQVIFYPVYKKNLFNNLRNVLKLFFVFLFCVCYFFNKFFSFWLIFFSFWWIFLYLFKWFSGEWTEVGSRDEGGVPGNQRQGPPVRFRHLYQVSYADRKGGYYLENYSFNIGAVRWLILSVGQQVRKSLIYPVSDDIQV